MNRNRKVFTAVCACALAATITAAGTGTLSNAATEHFTDAGEQSARWASFKSSWDQLSSDYEKVAMSVGADASQLNFGWYSRNAETPAVKIGTDKDLTDAKTFTGTQQEIKDGKDMDQVPLSGYYSNKVTVKGLKASTQYYYSVFKDGAWSTPASYSTEKTSSFSFMYVGDPQIGASKSQTSKEGDKLTEKYADKALAARNDAYNWNLVLENATNKFDNLSFILTAGDQVNTSNNEKEFAGFLSPAALSSVPLATAIGNHDAPTANYGNHFNYPNQQTSADTTEGRTPAGTDYYFSHGDALFIILDTNNYNCATHENVIKKAVKENKDAKWRIVVFHQDIYGSGLDHSDSDGIILRTQLTPLMDKYDIDMVLQGHDHTYSRTYQLTSDSKKHTAYSAESVKGMTEDDKASYLNQNQCYSIKSGKRSGSVTNPSGTVYMEANSGTGSKFYNLIPTQQDYISERSQTWTPSYSIVNVTKDTLSINTYDGITGKQLEGATSYSIKKTSGKKAETKKAASSKKTTKKSTQTSKKSTMTTKKSTTAK